jgi:hypothetical protein
MKSWGTDLGALRDRALFCKSFGINRTLGLALLQIAFESEPDELLADNWSNAADLWKVRVCKVTI